MITAQLLSQAKIKANLEKREQYILIEPMHNETIITRIVCSGDRLLITVLPDEDVI